MWKPGGAKPSNNNSDKGSKKKNNGRRPSSPGSNNNTLRDRKNDHPDGNVKNSDNAFALVTKNDDDDHDFENGAAAAGPNTPSAVAASSQKKLSGATMNMRFMQRNKDLHKHEQKFQQKQQQQIQNHPKSPRQTSTPIKMDTAEDDDEDDDPMQMDTATTDNDASVDAHSNNHQRLQPAHCLVDVIPATTSDMYGLSADIIGRRSFGGFNRAMEDTWKSSYRYQRDEEEEGSNSRSINEKISDEQLLQRYANLVKKRNNNGDDASRRTVGNLGDKVRPRKTISSTEKKRPRSGEKRKRR